MMRKVSVLMAVHNGEKYLRMAMDSILSQTYSDFEFIIVDDGSRDGTSQILNQYSDARIVLIKNEIGIGLTKSLNLGLEKARGEYIARMDADDVSLPHRLGTQVSFLDDHFEVGVVGTGAYLIDSANTSWQLVQYPEHHDQLCWIMCFFENPMLHPSVMFRAQLIKNLGGYKDAFVTSQDYNLWSRAVVITKLANIQDVCLHLRKHDENISKLRSEQQRQTSLEIGASIISRILGVDVKTARLQSYCEFLWNKSWMSQREVLFVAEIIFRLANNFLEDPQINYEDRLWIKNNAIKKINKLQNKLNLSLIARMKLYLLIRSMKHLS
jgi:glycosyltransferase involved in cell wall biosynthesis